MNNELTQLREALSIAIKQMDFSHETASSPYRSDGAFVHYYEAIGYARGLAKAIELLDK